MPFKVFIKGNFSTLYWLPWDNQQYIKENFGALPSYINLTEMKGYDTGSNAQKLLTGGSSYGNKNALIDTGIGLFLGSRLRVFPKTGKEKCRR
ncbi:hypothetical protein ACFOZY_09325 [Chungangia koreensis]|uniref:Uncharacterized protein n=1 Tax=Chungangia koreensis TaxID=752657 RepID=A0ABV8X3V4_9LACT